RAVIRTADAPIKRRATRIRRSLHSPVRPPIRESTPSIVLACAARRCPARRCPRRGPARGRAPGRVLNGQQNAHRRHPPGGNPGGGGARKPRRGIRLRVGKSPPAKRQYLSCKGDPGRTVAAGGVRRLRRQPARIPRLLRNSSRLLSDTGRRPAGADRRGGARASCPPGRGGPPPR